MPKNAVTGLPIPSTTSLLCKPLLPYCNDCIGSSISEIIQRPTVITPIEQCFVESGFCAYLVLHYDDPENPKLEAMNAVSSYIVTV